MGSTDFELGVLSTTVPLGLITFLAIPISRLFQWWSPSSLIIVLGGLSSLITLPIIVYLLSADKKSPLTRLAMFFSPFMFASAIDLTTSLEFDGFISGYMAFYLVSGEPYLGTAYSTAIQYWDGIVHYILYWAMLYDFSKGNRCFRAVSLYWFGTFFGSMIVLLMGSLSGPYAVHYPILLNGVYVLFPITYLVWILRTTKHHQPEVAPHPGGTLGFLTRIMFICVFAAFILISLVRGLGALGADRELVNFYINSIEKPVTHPHNYPRVTMMLYLLYGVPFFLYSIYGLVVNIKTRLSVDLSAVFAGLCCNAGYAGALLTGKPDKVEFDNQIYKLIFWTTNILLMVVPVLYALYCYNCYPVSAKRKQSKKSR